LARAERSTARLLARGWLRGSRPWYRGASAALAAAIVLMVLVSGTFSGMRHETEQRVADFYTDELRVTPRGAGALPTGLLGVDGGQDAGEAVGYMESKGASVSLRYESQFVLSRRGLVEAGLGEEGQFCVDAPGQAGCEEEVIALGSLVGVDLSDEAGLDPIRRHLVTGRLPTEAEAESPTVPLAMSVDRVARFMTAEEREGVPWPPSISDVGHLRFEVTAAVLEEGGSDIVRRPARIVGLFDTDVQVLDAFTVVAPIEHVRELNGHGAGDPVGNVLVVHSGVGAARDAAREQGWASEGPASFTHAYLGQLIDVLQGLSLLLAGSLFLLPAFLVTHGISRQLATHQREVAVCRALGVPPATLRSSMARLAGHLVLWAVAAAAVGAALLGLLLHWALPRADLPLPADLHVGWLELAPPVVALGAVGVAVWLAIRSAGHLDLGSTLRSL